MLMGILTGGGPAFAEVAFVLSFFAMTEKWKVKLKGEWIQTTAWLMLQSIVQEVQLEENWKKISFIRDN